MEFLLVHLYGHLEEFSDFSDFRALKIVVTSPVKRIARYQHRHLFCDYRIHFQDILAEL